MQLILIQPLSSDKGNHQKERKKRFSRVGGAPLGKQEEMVYPTSEVWWQL